MSHVDGADVSTDKRISRENTMWSKSREHHLQRCKRTSRYHLKVALRQVFVCPDS